MSNITESEEERKLEEKGNHIEVGLNGIIVSSYKASLREVEKTTNRLIRRHKSFVELQIVNKAKLGGVN